MCLHSGITSNEARAVIINANSALTDDVSVKVTNEIDYAKLPTAYHWAVFFNESTLKSRF
jgi:hypothetical protein